jgi:hypothetical protein
MVQFYQQRSAPGISKSENREITKLELASRVGVNFTGRLCVLVGNWL